MTVRRARVLFVVNSLILGTFVLFSWSTSLVRSQNQYFDVRGEGVSASLFYLVLLGLLIYLCFGRSNWLKVLQVLLWTNIAFLTYFLLANLSRISSALPLGASDGDALLIYFYFLILTPLAGFLVTLPATYVWIRTRREVVGRVG